MDSDPYKDPPYLAHGRDRAHVWAHKAEGPGKGAAQGMWRALMRYWVGKLSRRVGL